MERLIINADDFGLTAGVNRAVIDCFLAGVVSSTTLMVTRNAAAEAAKMAIANSRLGVGLHLNLTSGRPALAAARVPSLVNAAGRFPGLKKAAMRLTTGWARAGEIADEIEAQIELCRNLGVEPTHIDSHHHLHAHPRLRVIMSRVAAGMGITRARGYRMRWSSPKAAAIGLAAAVPLSSAGMNTPARFSGMESMGGAGTHLELGRALAMAGDSLEFMCHPGYVDEQLLATSTYAREREAELRALMSEEFRRTISESGAALISYREL